MGIQMTIEGSGFYYKQLWSLTNNSQLLGDIGIHIANHHPDMDMLGFNKNNKDLILDYSTGYRHELFMNQSVGPFRPLFIMGIGGMSDIKSFSMENIYGMCMIKYMLGLGLYFYNRRILNELSLQFIHSNAIKGHAAFQFAMYWK